MKKSIFFVCLLSFAYSYRKRVRPYFNPRSNACAINIYTITSTSHIAP